MLTKHAFCVCTCENTIWWLMFGYLYFAVWAGWSPKVEMRQMYFDVQTIAHWIHKRHATYFKNIHRNGTNGSLPNRFSWRIIGTNVNQRYGTYVFMTSAYRENEHCLNKREKRAKSVLLLMKIDRIIFQVIIKYCRNFDKSLVDQRTSFENGRQFNRRTPI